jgi:hypothetical protein
MNPPHDGECNPSHGDERSQPGPFPAQRTAREKDNTGHLHDDADLKESVKALTHPIGNRVGVMGRLAIDEKEGDRTENVEKAQRGKHRKCAQALSQAENRE